MAARPGPARAVGRHPDRIPEAGPSAAGPSSRSGCRRRPGS